MNNNFEDAYNQYFGKDEIYTPVQSEGSSTHSAIQHTLPTSASRDRMTANGNVDDIDKLGEILRKLLNAAWGSNWGTISPETSKGDDAEKIIVPQINYGINLREVADGSSPKPTLMDTIKEEVNGQPTGDHFRVYRQSFDCIVEFNFWDSTSKACRDLMNSFEEVIATYTGYLKKEGVSEIFFLKEVPAKYSLNYSDSTPMKCLYFFVRLERIKKIRVSAINEIEMKLSAKNEIPLEIDSNGIDKNIIYKL